MSSAHIANNLSELIGDTDLVRINSLSEISGCEILLKCEHQNPGGSIKDRAALQLVMDAVEAGKLKPGMTIVEGTAGNTGIGLALVAKSLGYKMLVVMPKGRHKRKSVWSRFITLNCYWSTLVLLRILNTFTTRPSGLVSKMRISGGQISSKISVIIERTI